MTEDNMNKPRHRNTETPSDQISDSPTHQFTDKSILVTGAAGFIGYHLAARLLKEGKKVVGVDNLNDYYDVNLKKARLAQIIEDSNFTFHKLDIADRKGMEDFFKGNSFDLVLHMAAQAGVRYSLENPHAYIDSNIVGFTNILEGCRHQSIKHLVFASSSSVYGANTKMPFSVKDNVDHPISLYAATKKANELMAHTYAHLYGIPCTGLRFFTVYGPWGRPDMAMFLFTKAILNGKPIDVYNYGKMKRDFTYIDDVVEGVLRVAEKVPSAHIPRNRETETPSSRVAETPRHRDTEIPSDRLTDSPYKIYNIGNNSPVELMTLIGLLEKALEKPAEKRMLPLQPGDVPATYADIDDLVADIQMRPNTSIQDGILRFVKWFKNYYGV